MTTQSLGDRGQTSARPSLTIGELSARAGVAVATLRVWETRHGFPRSRRLEGGHRRYHEREAELVAGVARLRDQGLRLDWAIAEVLATEQDTPSVFAVVRRRHPHIVAQRLRKATLKAMSTAVEDECLARGGRPWIIGAFQHERYFRQSERRWSSLARTARATWVLARFDEPLPAQFPAHASTDASGITLLSLPGAAPMAREWTVICVGDDHPVCLSAWELPGQDDVPDRERVFETLWTLDPVAVSDAARCCARVAADLGAEEADLADLVSMLGSSATRSPHDLQRSTDLFGRMLAYLDRGDPA